MSDSNIFFRCHQTDKKMWALKKWCVTKVAHCIAANFCKWLICILDNCHILINWPVLFKLIMIKESMPSVKSAYQKYVS